MKKILVFIDWYLPGYKAGGPIQSVANIVAHLSDRFEFYIITTDTDYLEEKPYEYIKSNEWNTIATNQVVYYFSKEKLNSTSLKQLIRSTVYDVVYINGVYSKYFSILPLLFSDKSKKIIIAPRGMFSSQGLGVKSIKKNIFVAICRLFRLYKRTIFQVTSSTEKADIKRLNLHPKSIVEIQNLPNLFNSSVALPIKEEGELRLISIARIAPEKNTLFALQCLSNYKYKGNIIFDLYGSIYDIAYWNECKLLINSLPENINVCYNGEIPHHKIHKILTDCHFSFLPSKGENFGHSILESLLSKTPVIISNNTPWKNLEKHNVGWDIDLKSPEVFYEKIQEAINLNDFNYKLLANGAFKFVEAQINTEKTKKKYIKLFDNLD